MNYFLLGASFRGAENFVYTSTTVESNLPLILREAAPGQQGLVLSFSSGAAGRRGVPPRATLTSSPLGDQTASPRNMLWMKIKSMKLL